MVASAAGLKKLMIRYLNSIEKFNNSHIDMNKLNNKILRIEVFCCAMLLLSNKAYL